ncbi:MAG: superoxide dismutase [Woeseiaceae bacterium]
MSVEFADLPYAADALVPHVSAKTLGYHHGKHHKSYVDKLNAAIAGGSYDDQSLEDIISAAHAADDTGIFNNAAQAWNHTFLWHSMSPTGGGEPAGPLADAINEEFGDLAGFQNRFRKDALGQFGSGWVWLVRTSNGLEIVATGNADTPLVHGAVPLLTLDVWEHAYYLDYQNRRGKYVDMFLEELVNWDFALQNFQADRAAA